MNVIRSSNSGIDRIALDDGWEGEGFPLFPLLQRDVGEPARAPSPLSNYAREATVDGWG